MVNPHNISNVQLGLQIDLRTSVQHEDLFSFIFLVGISNKERKFILSKIGNYVR